MVISSQTSSQLDLSASGRPSMKPSTRPFQRLFWSYYGPLVWDSKESGGKLPAIQMITELLQNRRKAPMERVLDAGCGTGEFSLALAEVGFDVTGVDFAAGMVGSARAKTSHNMPGRASFKVGDLNKPLSFPDECFDHCIHISVLQLVADPTATLKELWRLLKPEGTLVLLHVPRVPAANLTYRDALRSRLKKFETRGIWKTLWVAAKVYAERTTSVTYWTEVELKEMLIQAHFLPLSTESENPIVILSSKKDLTLPT